jgi:nucleotide-binding universal stress UspA family protein
MVAKILAANDGSEGAFKALAVAIDLARHYSAELHMISVEELPRFPASVDEIAGEQAEADQWFGRVIEQAHALGRSQEVELEHHLVSGHPVPTIIDFARTGGFDLLVIGFIQHAPIYDRLIGSTSDRLVEQAPCSVLVVK